LRRSSTCGRRSGLPAAASSWKTS